MFKVVKSLFLTLLLSASASLHTEEISLEDKAEFSRGFGYFIAAHVQEMHKEDPDFSQAVFIEGFDKGLIDQNPDTAFDRFQDIPDENKQEYFDGYVVGYKIHDIESYDKSEYMVVKEVRTGMVYGLNNIEKSPFSKTAIERDYAGMYAPLLSSELTENL